jgi:hypothetical protein
VAAERSVDPAGDARLAEAARVVLAGDGRSFVLQPWQIAYCFALIEGREPLVPPGCGVGKGWLDARLREALDTRDEPIA